MTFGLEKFIASKEVIQFIVFNVLAVVRTLLDILMWQVLVWIFQPSFGITKFFEKFKLNRYAISQVISFIISTFISYYTNKVITFGDDGPVRAYDIAVFAIISLVALGVSVWMIEFMTSNPKILKWVSNYKLLEKYWPLIAKLTTIIVTLFINYFGQKYFVFV